MVEMTKLKKAMQADKKELDGTNAEIKENKEMIIVR